MALPAPNHTRPDFGGVVLGAVAIFLASMSLGLVANHFSPSPVPVLVKTEGGKLPLPPGVIEVSLEETKRLYDEGKTPFLDARQPDVYARGHLPGAYNLPAEEFENRFLNVADTIEAAPAIVVYCHSADCGEALATVARLKEAYQGKIQVFTAGWVAWAAAKYPSRTGDKP